MMLATIQLCMVKTHHMQSCSDRIFMEGEGAFIIQIYVHMQLKISDKS